MAHFPIYGTYRPANWDVRSAQQQKALDAEMASASIDWGDSEAALRAMGILPNDQAHDAPNRYDLEGDR